MSESEVTWSPEAEADLQKVPPFAQESARANTEELARERGATVISLELWHEALSRRFPNGVPWQ